MMGIGAQQYATEMEEVYHANEINVQIDNAKFRLPYALRVFANSIMRSVIEIGAHIVRLSRAVLYRKR